MSASKARNILLAVIALTAAVWLLRATYAVSMPLVAACFVAAVVWPVHRSLSRTRWSWLALPASMSVALLIVLSFLSAVVTAVMFVADRSPQYAEALQDIWHKTVEWAASKGVPMGQLYSDDAVTRFTDWAYSWLTFGLTSLWAFGAFLVLIFFFTVFILLEARRWAAKANAAFDRADARDLIDTFRAVSTTVRRYLLTQSLIGAISAVAQGLLLWSLGVDLAFAWALLFLVMNYIPNIGSLIAMIPPILVTITTSGAGWAAVVLAGMSAIEVLIGYFVAPLWQAKNLSMSSLVVLLSVVFWGWVWGPVGAVLGVPLTVTIMIAAWHVDALRPLALLLSHTDDKADLDRQASAAKP